MPLYTMRYDIIYHPYPVNSQYLKSWGVDSPDDGNLQVSQITAVMASDWVQERSKIVGTAQQLKDY